MFKDLAIKGMQQYKFAYNNVVAEGKELFKLLILYLFIKTKMLEIIILV